MGELLKERYEVKEIVGRGGQGDIASAWDTQLGRPVALKIRRLWSTDDREELLAEARVLLALRPHGSLPLIRDDFFTDDSYVLVLDWVEGVDLARLVGEQGDPGLPPTTVLKYLGQLAAALDHLHDHDPPIVHGDVKPANAIVTPEGKLVLVDFGLATSTSLPGTVAGSAGYVAPEVVAGARPMPGADVYGFAATAVALLTGTPPSDPEVELVGLDPQLRRPLERGLRRALDLDPRLRPRTAGELMDLLTAYVEVELPTGVVTFFFTDIEGSSSLWDAHPEAMAKALVRHESIITDTVEANGGRVIKGRGEGDSTLSVFQRASDAARASLELQRRLKREPWPDQITIRVRIGMHTGEAELRDNDYFGPALNRAARVRSLARGGQILVSRATADLVVDALPTGASLIDLGTHELRGLSRAEVVFAIGHPDLDTAVYARGGPTSASSATTTLTTDDVPSIAPGLPTSEITAFVGRSHERDVLDRTWAAAVEGRHGIVFLAGEPGIGKTRLATETARTAHAAGGVVLVGRCDQHSSVPYQPFVEALRPYVAALNDATLHAQLGSHAAALVRILPELAQRIPNLEPRAGLDPETEQHQLFEAVSTLIEAAAAVRPVFLLVDDAHWSDRSSLLLLRHLYRRPGQHRIMIAVTYRSTEVDRKHPMSSVLADLNREPGFERCALSGLEDGDVVQMLESLGGAQLDTRGRRFAWLLRRRTQGNPLFVFETVRSLSERGLIRRGDQTWISDLEPEEIGVPEGVKEVIGQRLEHLSPAAYQVLRVGAVAGAEWRLDVVERVADLADADVLDAVDEAVAAGLIAGGQGAEERYHFTHALVRDTLYDDLSPSRRNRIHRKIAETLEEVLGAKVTTQLGELAHHYLQAAPLGTIEQAIDYSIRAGDAAEDQVAYGDAVAHYERALGALAEGAHNDELHLELLLKLGAVRWSAGDYVEARSACLEAARLAEEHGKPDVAAAAAVGFGGDIGYLQGVEDPALVRLLERCLEILPSNAVASRAMVLARLSEASVLTEAAERSGPLAAEAITLAESSGDPGVLAYVLSRALFSMWRHDNTDERLERCRQLALTGERAGDQRAVLWGRFGLFITHMERAERDEALEALAEALRLSEELHDSYTRWLVALIRGIRDLWDVPLDEATATLNAAVDVGQLTRNFSSVQLWGVQIYWVLTERSRVIEMHAAMKASIEFFPAPARYEVALALLYVEAGMDEEARALLDKLTANDCALILNDMLWTGNVTILVEVALALDDLATARRLEQKLLAIDDVMAVAGGVAVVRGAVAHYLGLVAAAHGEWDVAEARFRKALELETRLGVRAAIGHSRVELAKVLRARGRAGDAEEATALLELVRSEITGYGFARLEAQIDGAQNEDTGSDGPTKRTWRQRARRRVENMRAALSIRGRSAMARFTRDVPDQKLALRFGTPMRQRAIFAAMARSFQPRLAFGFEGTIAFELRWIDENDQNVSSSWVLEVVGDRCSAKRGEPDGEPALAVRIELASFLRIMSGERNILGAFIDGSVETDGDPLLAARLVEMFGGEMPFDDDGSVAMDEVTA